MADPQVSSLLSGTFKWIYDNLSLIAPAPAPQPESAPRLGPLLDLAIVCQRAREGWLPDDAAEVAEACLDRLVDICGHDEWRGALEWPGRYYTWLIAVLRRADRPADGPGYETVRHLVEAGQADFLTGKPRSVRDALEARYVLDICDLTVPSMPLLGSLYPDSAINTRVIAADISESMAFDITHVILFLSDMGSRPVTGLTSAQERHAKAVIDELLQYYHPARHWDLTAELLICRRVLGAEADEACRAARASLLAAQVPSGMLPGPAFSAARHAALPASERPPYELACCLHTTLAATLYGATSGHYGQ